MNFFTYTFALVVLLAVAYAVEDNDNCPIACADIYAPVCAKNRNEDLQTFPNFCEFQTYICKNKESGYNFYKNGECSVIKKDTQCPIICTADYNPVCAKNRDGEFQTFPNFCAMKVYLCKNKDSSYVFFKDGECSDMKKNVQCNDICTEDYTPVCAKNRNGEFETFSNLCRFEAFMCKNKNSGFELYNNGECSTVKKSNNCPRACPMNYLPVCTKNRDGASKTFDNMCEFEAFTCRNKDSGFQLYKTGECSVEKKETSCPQICPLNFTPICAKNRNGESKTFANFCNFEAFTCKNKDSGFLFYKAGECSVVMKEANCAKACPLNYAPICAKNRDGESKTFANFCEFQAFICKNKDSGFQLFKGGECSVEKKEINCPRACPFNFAPICAKTRDGESKTFANLCEFESFTCKNKDSGFELFQEGECSAMKKATECNSFCTDDYTPVCAKNRNGEFQTFPNFCEFESFACKNKQSEFQLYKAGECSSMKKETGCNSACTDDYRPVCAKNRKGEFQTFSNFCELESFACKNKQSGFELYKTGECSIEKKETNCARACPLIFAPLCAKNRNGEFQTFDNYCYFEAFTCANKLSGYQFYKDGKCETEKKDVKCTIACPAIFAPVCAKNRDGEFQTFSNLCSFEAYTCRNQNSGYEFYKNGECVDVKKNTKCPVACIEEYDPICTINRDGKLQSFTSFCDYQMYQCKHPQSGVEFFRNAQC